MISRQEKHAWFNLAVFGLGLLLFFAFLPRVGFHRATAALAVCGLWGLAPLLFYPRKTKWKDIFDERDLLIQRTSWAIAHGTFWAVFVIGQMTLWGLNRERGTVDVEVLPLTVFGGMMVIFVVGSIATLILYRRT